MARLSRMLRAPDPVARWLRESRAASGGSLPPPRRSSPSRWRGWHCGSARARHRGDARRASRRCRGAGRRAAHDRGDRRARAQSRCARAPDARAGLERVLVQQGLRPAVTQLEWQEGRARIVFAAIGYDALIVALEALQRDAQLRAVDLTMTARVEPGQVRAELTLAR